MKSFKIGDRVVLNKEWERRSAMPFNNYHAGREAKVVGVSRTPDCVRVVFLGQKTPQTYHVSFFDKKESVKK